MSPPKGSSKKAAGATAGDAAALAAANLAGGTTAASRAPAGLPDAVRDQHTHVTSGPDLNYNVRYFRSLRERERERRKRKEIACIAFRRSAAA